MKTVWKSLMAAAAIALAVNVSEAQIVVRARIGRPAHRVVVRPTRPSPRAVWVEDDYAPRGRTYVYRGGYWANPPRPGTVWVNGHWQRRGHGWVWIAGFWR